MEERDSKGSPLHVLFEPLEFRGKIHKILGAVLAGNPVMGQYRPYRIKPILSAQYRTQVRRLHTGCLSEFPACIGMAELNAQGTGIRIRPQAA